jgi:hypothetical protein
MKKLNLSLVLLILFVSSICFPQDQYKNLDLSNQILKNGKSLNIEANFDRIEKDFDKKSDDKEKNPYLAALFSAVVPGAGEFYAKSYIKSAIFFAVEVGLWTFYGINQGKGNSKTDEYEDYANKNWNIKKYGQWLKEQQFNGASNIDTSLGFEPLRQQINNCEQINFSHTLPPFGDQQYYEVIGKYQNFIYGWLTAGPNITKNNYETYVLPQVQDYMSDRQKANDYFNIAGYSVDLVVLNHILSAADAAWSVSIFNRQLKVNTSLNLQRVYSYNLHRYKLTPFANLRIVF